MHRKLELGLFGAFNVSCGKVEQAACNIWHPFTNNATAVVKNFGWFGTTACDNASLLVEDSKEMEIELCYGDGLSLT